MERVLTFTVNGFRGFLFSKIFPNFGKFGSDFSSLLCLPLSVRSSSLVPGREQRASQPPTLPVVTAATECDAAGERFYPTEM